MKLWTDISAAVLLVINRFSSRIGLPELLVSDNLKSFTSIELKIFLLKSSIKWQLILEKSLWLGGLCERLVGIVKNYRESIM